VSIDVWSHSCESDLGLVYANGNVFCWDLKSGFRFVGKMAEMFRITVYIYILYKVWGQ